MAKVCFCGCGRRIPKFPIGTRAINTRGRLVSERLVFVDDEHPHLKGENEEIAAWIEQGRAIRAELVAAMHGEMNPRELNEGTIREWQAEGRNIERFINEMYGRLGRWARESGLTEEEAREAIKRGEYPGPGQWGG